MIVKRFNSKLAGRQYNGPALDLFLSRDDHSVSFEFDPSCEYDENAIKVLDAVSGSLLGYVERNVAAEVADVNGNPIEIHGILNVSKKQDIDLEFEVKYEPIPVPTEKELLEQISYYEKQAVQALQDFIVEIHSPKYYNVSGFCNIGNAERALYLLDPNNPLISDSENVKRQKTIERMLSGNNGEQNAFFDILNCAKVEYHAPNKPAAFFNFPNADRLDLSCRFYGKTVLFTGFWPEEKAQISVVCEVLNLTQAASVCKKLDFLICGSNAGPAKMRKADQLNIPIVQATDFIREITIQEK